MSLKEERSPMSLFEKTKISIYKFSLYGENKGPLRERRKLLYRLARIYTVADSMSWLFWLRVKATGRKFLAFVIGADIE